MTVVTYDLFKCGLSQPTTAKYQVPKTVSPIHPSLHSLPRIPPTQLGLKVIICFVTQTLFLWSAPTFIAQSAAEDQSSHSQWGPRCQDSRFVN